MAPMPMTQVAMPHVPMAQASMTQVAERGEETETISHDESRTFDEVHARVISDDKGKWDVVLPRTETVMQNGKIFFPDCNAYECESGLELSSWATGQICSRLNIPSAYFKRCPAQLQDEQFNWWNGDRPEESFDENEFSQGSNAQESSDKSFESHNGYHSQQNFEPDGYRNGKSQIAGYAFESGLYTGQGKTERWLLRAKGETLRALFTDRYTPIDNRMLLRCLHRSLPSQLKVQWIALDEESFHLRLFDPTRVIEVENGDPLMAGLHISNSEVGKRSVTIDAIVYRQVCSNGLIRLIKGKSLMQQRHIAVASGHLVSLLQRAMQQALTTSHEFLEQMVWSATEPINDVESEMKKLTADWHLSQAFVEQVEARLLNEERTHQDKLFGLVNALTRTAQSLNAEQRYDMEVLAGKFLERRLAKRERDVMPRSNKLVALPHSAIESAKVLLGAEEVTS
jgi:hypothetical protein